MVIDVHVYARICLWVRACVSCAKHFSTHVALFTLYTYAHRRSHACQFMPKNASLPAKCPYPLLSHCQKALHLSQGLSQPLAWTHRTAHGTPRCGPGAIHRTQVCMQPSTPAVKAWKSKKPKSSGKIQTCCQPRQAYSHLRQTSQRDMLVIVRKTGMLE